MKAKDRHRKRLIEYLGDWENDFPNKSGLAKILGLKHCTLYFHFTPAELNEICDEGLELRKRQAVNPRAEIYKAMLKSAKDGVVPAQKEFLDRTEGKVVDRLQVGIDETTLNIILTTLPPEQAEKTKKALMAIAKKEKKT